MRLNCFEKVDGDSFFFSFFFFFWYALYLHRSISFWARAVHSFIFPKYIVGWKFVRVFFFQCKNALLLSKTHFESFNVSWQAPEWLPFFFFFFWFNHNSCLFIERLLFFRFGKTL